MQENSDIAVRAETSLALYFKDRLTAYAEQADPPPNEETCWYLGNLLDRFGRSDAFYTYDNGALTLRPLALLYSDAREAPSEMERCLLLQQLGDLALFIGAVFPHRYARRGIKRDYFIGMGGGAYDYLADNARSNRHIFAELSGMFANLLEMVADACSRVESLTTEEIMRLYQRWTRNHDPIAERQLTALGIDLQQGVLHH